MADRAGVVPQLLGAAVGIVLGSALLFSVVGMLRDDAPPEPEVVAQPAASPSAAAEEAVDGEEPADDEAAAEDDDPTADESPSPEEAPVEEEPSEAPAEEESEAPAESSGEEVDPASISIQVLDAVGGDGGSQAAQAVADELREAGYDVVVVNRAGRDYDATTVFWSEGQATGGQQVAAALGASEARQTPEEVQLSNSVDVHVVVGADRT